MYDRKTLGCITGLITVLLFNEDLSVSETSTKVVIFRGGINVLDGYEVKRFNIVMTCILISFGSVVKKQMKTLSLQP